MALLKNAYLNEKPEKEILKQRLKEQEDLGTELTNAMELVRVHLSVT